MKRTGRQKDIVTPEKKQEQRELLRLFSANIRKILKNTDLLADDLQEIRLRTGAPLLVVAKDQEYFLTPDGALTGEWEKGYPVSPTDIRDTMDYIGSFSLYAYEDELRQGFLTVEGGHRIGIAGKTVIEGEKVKGISHISCINVRVAHEKKGCADRVMPYLWEDGRFLHTLIVSAPGCGKTTMLRDIIRQISDGESPYPGLTVGVVDERSEIAGCYLGVAQNDVGIRTDVLDCCPKAEGMMMLIRAMSPDVVAVDEIGTGEDIRAIESVVNCGCKLLATVHGNSMEDMKQKPLLNRLVESHVFERYIVLDAKPHAGSVQAIFDGRGTTLYRRRRFCDAACSFTGGFSCLRRDRLCKECGAVGSCERSGNTAENYPVSAWRDCDGGFPAAGCVLGDGKADAGSVPGFLQDISEDMRRPDGKTLPAILEENTAVHLADTRLTKEEKKSCRRPDAALEPGTAPCRRRIWTGMRHALCSGSRNCRKDCRKGRGSVRVLESWEAFFYF